MIVGDLLDEKTLAKAISGCEVVYNFAAIADLDEALNKPIETAKINVLGNGMILEACRKAKVQRYIFASTLYSLHSCWWSDLELQQARKYFCHRLLRTMAQLCLLLSLSQVKALNQIISTGFYFRHPIVDLNRRKSRSVAEVLRGMECEAA